MTTKKAHAEFSASGSERWLNCAASIQLSRKAPPQEDSPYAKEGTDAHKCLEYVLTNYKSLAEFDSEMIKHAFFAMKEIKTLRNDVKGTFLTESKVSLEFVEPGMFGTLDVAVVEEFGRLVVIDYKYGAGVPVDPDENSQLIYYALGIAHQYDFNFSEVELVVIQPRADHEKGPVRSWVMSIDDLMKWEHIFRAGVKKALGPNPPYKAGDWCRWCPAQSICPEISTRALEQVEIDFEPEESSDIVLPAPHAITPQKLSHTLTGIEKLEKWIDAVKEHALHVLKEGQVIPGFKLVQKRSTRKWVDEEKVKQRAIICFGTKAITEKLLSPAQLEKAVDGSKKFIDKHTTSESSGVTIAKASDKRPEINQIEKDFTDIDEAVAEMQTVTALITFQRKGDKMATKKRAAKKAIKKAATKKTKK